MSYSNLGDLGKAFCAPNKHKFAEINELAKKVQALNLGDKALATMSPRNQTLSAVLGLWVGGGACCGDCTDGLDADFDFLTGMLATAPKGISIISPEEENAILQEALPLPPVEASFLARNAMPLLVGGSALVLGTLGLILMIKI